jgi:triacylglycerol lipase
MKIISSSCSLLLGFCALSAQANTSSPFQPPDEGLGKYVINQGAGLDTGCTFSSGSPLIINLFVPAVVNDARIDSNGTLIDAADLVNKGRINAQAALRFPVFDIDSNANIPGFQPEVDKISWNGKEVKTLSGVNNVWTDDSLVVPIEEVKFGTDNEFRVDIDVANSGDNWCMSVDWVAIEFNVALPYVLAHGINADRST